MVSPKVVLRSAFVTHEEITLQYSRYWDGADALPQQWLAVAGVQNINKRDVNGAFLPLVPNDRDVFGAKATLWW